MTTTPRLTLDYLDESQSGKETLFNSDMDRLALLVQSGVIDKDLATPPGSPTAGDCYIIAASPTGAWSGKATQIGMYTASG